METLFEVSENYTIAGGLGEKTRSWSTSEEAVSLPFPPPTFPIWIQHAWYLDGGVWCLVPDQSQTEHQESPRSGYGSGES